MAASPGSTGMGVRRGLSSQACRAQAWCVCGGGGAGGYLGHLSQAWGPHLPLEGQVECSAESICGSFWKVPWTSLEAPESWQVEPGQQETPVYLGSLEREKESEGQASS